MEQRQPGQRQGRVCWERDRLGRRGGAPLWVKQKSWLMSGSFPRGEAMGRGGSGAHLGYESLAVNFGRAMSLPWAGACCRHSRGL